MEPLENRLARLVQRVLRGNVVPFVGAGISMAARSPAASDFQPTVGWMSDALHHALDQCLQQCPEAPANDPWSARFLLSPPGNPQGPECATLRALLCTGQHAVNRVQITDIDPGACTGIAGERAELQRALRKAADPDLGQLAEIGHLLWGPIQVCDILRIDQFASLRPLPAHRYLAYLAREGLITEIITTNYDCCIERAYRCSLGLHCDASDPDDLDGGTPAVIRNLEEYRRKSERFYVPAAGLRQPILRLYKINGCARGYRDAKRERERNPTKAADRMLQDQARRIILTERQLQSFRDENWAHDLFRDRARTRNLLFIGFGSQEPQVRHAALAITAEFEQQCADISSDEAARLPNAPWVAAHDQLSFYQVQMLAGFVQAHIGKDGAGPPLACRIAPLLENCFLGPDGRTLGAGESKLSADAFLRALFERTFAALLESELHDGSTFTSWLRAQAPDTWRLWRACLQPLAPRPHPNGTEVALAGAPALPPSCADLLAPSENEPNDPLRLWRWLWAMRQPSRGDRPAPFWYLPLTDDPLLVLLTLLLACVLRSDRSDEEGTCPRCDRALPRDWDFVCPVRGRGIEIRLAAGSRGEQRSLYLIEDQAIVQPRPLRPAQLRSARNERVGAHRLVRCIVLPSTRPRSDRLCTERPPSEPGGIGQLHVGSRQTLSAAELIRRARRPDAVGDLLDDLFAAQRTEPRAKGRLRPLPPSRGEPTETNA